MSLKEGEHAGRKPACSASHRKPGCGVGREGALRGPAEPFGKRFIWFHHPKETVNHGDSQRLVDIESLGEYIKNNDSQKF